MIGEPKTNGKPNAKADAKMDAKAESKPIVKADAKANVKMDARSNARMDVKMKEAAKVSLADQATIPLHALYAAKDADMNSSVTDLIGMIDNGAAPKEPAKPIAQPNAKGQDILELRQEPPVTRQVMSQRGIKKRPFEQAKP